MPYYKIETIEYVPKVGFYWAFKADSKEDAIKKIESGQVFASELFHAEGNHIEIKVEKIEDVTETVNQIINDNIEYEKAEEILRERNK